MIKDIIFTTLLVLWLVIGIGLIVWTPWVGFAWATSGWLSNEIDNLGRKRKR